VVYARSRRCGRAHLERRIFNGYENKVFIVSDSYASAQNQDTSNSKPVSTLPRAAIPIHVDDKVGNKGCEWLSMNMDRSTTCEFCRCRLYLSKDVRLLQPFRLSTLDWALYLVGRAGICPLIISIVFIFFYIILENEAPQALSILSSEDALAIPLSTLPATT
jgi:hypothetical protein